ncbi:hypothetical protein [Paraclostridium bifermentans]|uniref:hypothetical protein n=1 Tax=Paraclostridium bifermentans TaxID=1490 RepID=UPI00189712B8|nr:hypothetical protein [Paraclostridium bifermentans]
MEITELTNENFQEDREKLNDMFNKEIIDLEFLDKKNKIVKYTNCIICNRLKADIQGCIHTFKCDSKNCISYGYISDEFMTCICLEHLKTIEITLSSKLNL